MTLSYLDVFKANDLFRRLPNTFDREWIHAKKFVDWDNLYNLSDEEVMRRVVKFLNRWSSHIPKRIEVVHGIKEAHRDSLPYLDALRNENLWDIDFNKEIIVYNKKYSSGELILNVFKFFRDIGYHLREVAASKLLHHINPNLFIMWDNKIMKKYGVKRSAHSYAYDFLPQMKTLLNEVIDSYMQDNDVDRSTAILELNSHSKHKTMVKLLDEYNWINYTYFG